MNNRERQLAVIRHEVPDRICVDTQDIRIVPEIARDIGIAQGEVLDYLGVDGREIPVGWVGEIRKGPDGDACDPWGTVPAAHGRPAWHPLSQLATPGELDRHAWPDPRQFDFAEAARRAAGFEKHYATRGPCGVSLFARTCALCGTEKTLSLMRDNPALFEATIDKVFEIACETVRQYLDACGQHLDILSLRDVYAGDRGLLFDAEMFRRYIKPRLARLFELGRNAGKPVWFQGGGNIVELLPDLIDIGMDVLAGVQLGTLPVSAERLKEEYGSRITFFGGMDTRQLPKLAAEEVTMTVEEVVRALGRHGGFILGPDRPIGREVPPENVLTLFRAATGFAEDQYTLPL